MQVDCAFLAHDMGYVTLHSFMEGKSFLGLFLVVPTRHGEHCPRNVVRPETSVC